MRPLVIYGAGGFGAEVAALVEDINRDSPTWELAGFLDDDAARHGEEVLGYPIIGDASWLWSNGGHAYVIAIGSPRVRARAASALADSGARAAVLVHPAASVHESSIVGDGTIICRGAIVTVRVTLGNHCIANLNATVGHDSTVGSFTTLYPAVNLSGNARTADRVEVGTGAVLLPGTRVGSGAVVGAGAVVTKDIAADCVAVGVPAVVTRSLAEPVTT